MSSNAHKVESAVLVTLTPGEVPSEAELRRLVTGLATVYPLTADEIDTLLRRLHSKLAIRMDTGVALVTPDHRPWLSARKPTLDTFYWQRFFHFLGSKSWPTNVVSAMDRTSDDLLDLCGDPARQGTWQRRGLVVGDVQSGKTSTYTALSCKAADAGYRVIILLTGTLESLRRQTQERLDQGFVGLDSSGFLSAERKRKEIGVGEIDGTRTGVVFTSRLKDFSALLVNQLNFRLDAFHEPVLLVVKKNKRILENLQQWLRDFNADRADGKVRLPLLLIDDEADNASVNTRRPDEEVTAINKNIRALLALFSQASYVGFTATPFANIFIDPENESEMFGDDLFPKDYVLALEPPTNYVGPSVVFDESGPDVVRRIDDAESAFPRGHRTDHIVDTLPGSLLDALDAFLMANVLRDLRGEGLTHRSMLVNVSAITNVQMQVTEQLDQELRRIQSDVRNYARLSPVEALQNGTIRRLKACWQNEFRSEGGIWDVVQERLRDAVLPVEVRAVNQRTGAASLDYSQYADAGFRVIAIGGNSLSRGLTLEGLSTSYFYRNSQMYDTLLQMGRWFGYRDNYSDVCRLYLTEEARLWYSHIARASEELRAEIRSMRAQNLTPLDFGLRVRAHPDSLIVTARNKMRSAQLVERLISVSHQAFETTRLNADPKVVENNVAVLRGFVRRLAEAGIQMGSPPSGSSNPFWTGVDRAEVARFLRNWTAHPKNLTFQVHDLAAFLESSREPRLTTWDIVIPQGRGSRSRLTEQISFKLQEREVVRAASGELVVSGKSSRVGSRGVEREGLTLTEVAEAERNFRREHGEKKNVSDLAYRLVRERPLLLIHALNPYPALPGATADIPLVALGVSFPKFDDAEATKKVAYHLNVVAWRSLFEAEIDDDDEAEHVA